MKITEQQFKEAIIAKEAAESTIIAYGRQKAEDFTARHAKFEAGEQPYTDDELFYSAATLCPCGHGLAYPKNCGMHHHWDCSAILKGIADPKITHEGKLPFAFYDIKGEHDLRGTTRGVFRPKPLETP